jgi:hypothetical protein
MLSAGVSVDVRTYKVRRVKDFLFSFAGTYSNADLIFQEISRVLCDKKEVGRDQLQKTLQEAYQHRLAQVLAHRHLASYDLDMEAFRREGLRIFGDERFPEISRNIEHDASSFAEQILVSGFASDHPLAVLYEIDRSDITSHCIDGLAAIGSGGDVALTTLLLLQCARHMPLEFAIYAVAAAKFSAENCDGVGKSTVMLLMRKDDKSNSDVGAQITVVQPLEIEALRKAWEGHGRPRIPRQTLPALNSLARKAGITNPLEHLEDQLKSMRSEAQK